MIIFRLLVTRLPVCCTLSEKMRGACVVLPPLPHLPPRPVMKVVAGQYSRLPTRALNAREIKAVGGGGKWKRVEGGLNMGLGADAHLFPRTSCPGAPWEKLCRPPNSNHARGRCKGRWSREKETAARSQTSRTYGRTRCGSGWKRRR